MSNPTPDEPVDVDAMTHQVARAVADLRQIFAPIDEAALGYRAQLEADGWSPTVAEQMAYEFHAHLRMQCFHGGSA